MTDCSSVFLYTSCLQRSRIFKKFCWTFLTKRMRGLIVFDQARWSRNVSTDPDAVPCNWFSLKSYIESGNFFPRKNIWEYQKLPPSISRWIFLTRTPTATSRGVPNTRRWQRYNHLETFPRWTWHLVQRSFLSSGVLIATQSHSFGTLETTFHREKHVKPWDTRVVRKPETFISSYFQYWWRASTSPYGHDDLELLDNSTFMSIFPNCRTSGCRSVL